MAHTASIASRRPNPGKCARQGPWPAEGHRGGPRSLGRDNFNNMKLPQQSTLIAGWGRIPVRTQRLKKHQAKP
eukprot:14810664-Alexandrium_andersonii.AAC.1